MSEQKAVIKCLTGADVQVYLNHDPKKDNLFRLIRESFQLKFDHTRGLEKADISDYINGLADADLRQTMDGMKLLGECKSSVVIDQKTGSQYRKAIVAYIQRPDKKYDILVVSATQTKELDYQKVVACGVGSLALGILAGFITMNPWVGVRVGVCAGAASGVKSAYDNSEPMPDVLAGFMLEELVRLRVLSILQNNEIELVID